MANEERCYILLELGGDLSIAVLAVTAGAGKRATATGGNMSRNNIDCYNRS